MVAFSTPHSTLSLHRLRPGHPNHQQQNNSGSAHLSSPPSFRLPPSAAKCPLPNVASTKEISGPRLSPRSRFPKLSLSSRRSRRLVPNNQTKLASCDVDLDRVGSSPKPSPRRLPDVTNCRNLHELCSKESRGQSLKRGGKGKIASRSFYVRSFLPGDSRLLSRSKPDPWIQDTAL